MSVIKIVNLREKNLKHTYVKTKPLSKKTKNIVKILKRSDFLDVSSKYRVRAKGLYLQGQRRSEEDSHTLSNVIRVGFTCSKKIGNAVRRNFAKRRLRHVARDCLPKVGKIGWDYILIGHYNQTEEMDFNDLKNSFTRAVNQIKKFEKIK